MSNLAKYIWVKEGGEGRKLQEYHCYCLKVFHPTLNVFILQISQYFIFLLHVQSKLKSKYHMIVFLSALIYFEILYFQLD